MAGDGPDPVIIPFHGFWLAAGSAGAMTGFSHPAVLASVLRAYEDGGFVAAA